MKLWLILLYLKASLQIVECVPTMAQADALLQMNGVSRFGLATVSQEAWDLAQRDGLIPLIRQGRVVFVHPTHAFAS